MSIYTKTGDDGETGLLGNQRVPKENARVQAYGTVDELNSVLGLCRCEALTPERDAELRIVQESLFELGADLASVGGETSRARLLESTKALEASIDRLDAELSPLRSFILPGGGRPASFLHLARTVCRRAEREVWALHRQHPLPLEFGRYLNRLADALFVWARAENASAGIADVPWQPASS